MNLYVNVHLTEKKNIMKQSQNHHEIVKYKNSNSSQNQEESFELDSSFQKNNQPIIMINDNTKNLDSLIDDQQLRLKLRIK